jgi:hypothetical protein
MIRQSGEHEWGITNVRSGWLVTETCLHCGARTSFFSVEERPPLDHFIEGDHDWRTLGSAQAIRFDLACAKTGEVAKLNSVLGLSLCVGCNPECFVGALSKLLVPSGTWVYLALCADPSHASGKCVGPDEVKALTEYFNARITTPGKRVLFLPCSLRRNADQCRGDVVADLGMTAAQ